MFALYSASRDPRVPWHAKLAAAAVFAYLVSPIDLVPDFIPVLGQLDDLVIVSLGVLLVRGLVPREIMAEHRARAAAELNVRVCGWIGVALTVTLWALGLAVVIALYSLLR